MKENNGQFQGKNYFNVQEENDEYKDINSYSTTEDISSYSQEFARQNIKREQPKLTRKEKKMVEKRNKEIDKIPRKFFKKMWIAMVLVISIAISEFLIIGMTDLLAIDRTSNSRASVSIPKDASNKEIATILKSAGVIKYQDYFTYYLNIFEHSADFTMGDYDIPTDLDYAGISAYLLTQTNRTDAMSVTFPEGKNIVEYGQILEDNGICSKDDFLKECTMSKYTDDYTFISDITNGPDRYYKLEGYLYPDTYTCYKDSNPANIVTNMLNNFEAKVVDKNKVDGYDSSISIEQIANQDGMTLDELMTLASLVQAEAANTSDMQMIAGIFMNRLYSDEDLGFRYLGSDATVYYPYRTKDDAPQGYDSKYDTYNIEGLPPGPICNPSMEAIQAVLNPTSSNYMYFAHDVEGNAYYAVDEVGQQKNLIKIQNVNAANE